MKTRTMVCVLLFVAAGAAQNADSLVDQAIGLYETRHLNSANLDSAFATLERVVQEDAKNARAFQELSKVCFLLGDRAKDKAEKLERFYMGRDHGRKAIDLDDGAAEAHFWYMVNIGRVGQTKGVLNSLALVPEVRKEIERVLEIDPQHTGALDAQAMLYYELPGLLGGNLNKSMASLNKGIALDSSYALLYVDMANVCIKKKDYEKARWHLNRALAIERPTYEADYVLDDKPAALRLLEEIKDK